MHQSGVSVIWNVDAAQSNLVPWEGGIDDTFLVKLLLRGIGMIRPSHY
jgi:hypothetical protein